MDDIFGWNWKLELDHTNQHINATCLRSSLRRPTPYTSDKWWVLLHSSSDSATESTGVLRSSIRVSRHSFAQWWKLTRYQDLNKNIFVDNLTAYLALFCVQSSVTRQFPNPIWVSAVLLGHFLSRLSSPIFSLNPGFPPSLSQAVATPAPAGDNGAEA